MDIKVYLETERLLGNVKSKELDGLFLRRLKRGDKDYGKTQ
ncbi:hypothetical protein [Clostridium kluyveri]|nr:hypothetical protein [Clostridium kluyveri]